MGGSSFVCCAVAAFHHLQGPVCEWAHPINAVSPETLHQAANLALPDGIHNLSDEKVFFSLSTAEQQGGASEGSEDVNRASSGEILYGCAFFSQISSKDLAVVDSEVTRASVQKSVILLSRTPCFGYLWERLLPVSKVYFEQRDFSERECLSSLAQQLISQSSAAQEEHGVTLNSSIDVYEGLPMREFVTAFGSSIGTIIKACMLGRPLVVFSKKPSTASSFAVCVAALFPGTLASLCNDASVAAPNIQFGKRLMTAVAKRAAAASPANKHGPDDDAGDLPPPPAELKVFTMQDAGFPLAIVTTLKGLFPILGVEALVEFLQSGGGICGASNPWVLERAAGMGATVANADTGRVTVYQAAADGDGWDGNLTSFERGWSAKLAAVVSRDRQDSSFVGSDTWVLGASGVFLVEMMVAFARARDSFEWYDECKRRYGAGFSGDLTRSDTYATWVSSFAEDIVQLAPEVPISAGATGSVIAQANDLFRLAVAEIEAKAPSTAAKAQAVTSQVFNKVQGVLSDESVHSMRKNASDKLNIARATITQGVGEVSRQGSEKVRQLLPQVEHGFASAFSSAKWGVNQAAGSASLISDKLKGFWLGSKEESSAGSNAPQNTEENIN